MPTSLGASPASARGRLEYWIKCRTWMKNLSIDTWEFHTLFLTSTGGLGTCISFTLLPWLTCLPPQSSSGLTFIQFSLSTSKTTTPSPFWAASPTCPLNYGHGTPFIYCPTGPTRVVWGIQGLLLGVISFSGGCLFLILLLSLSSGSSGGLGKGFHLLQLSPWACPGYLAFSHSLGLPDFSGLRQVVGCRSQVARLDICHACLFCLYRFVFRNHELTSLSVLKKTRTMEVPITFFNCWYIFKINFNQFISTKSVFSHGTLPSHLLTEAGNRPRGNLDTLFCSKGIKTSFETTIITNFSCKRKEGSKKNPKRQISESLVGQSSLKLGEINGFNHSSMLNYEQVMNMWEVSLFPPCTCMHNLIGNEKIHITGKQIVNIFISMFTTKKKKPRVLLTWLR